MGPTSVKEIAAVLLIMMKSHTMKVAERKKFATENNFIRLPFILVNDTTLKAAKAIKNKSDILHESEVYFSHMSHFGET